MVFKRHGAFGVEAHGHAPEGSHYHNFNLSDLFGLSKLGLIGVLGLVAVGVGIPGSAE